MGGATQAPHPLTCMPHITSNHPTATRLASGNPLRPTGRSAMKWRPLRSLPALRKGRNPLGSCRNSHRTIVQSHDAPHTLPKFSRMRGGSVALGRIAGCHRQCPRCKRPQWQSKKEWGDMMAELSHHSPPVCREVQKEPRRTWQPQGGRTPEVHTARPDPRGKTNGKQKILISKTVTNFHNNKSQI